MGAKQKGQQLNVPMEMVIVAVSVLATIFIALIGWVFNRIFDRLDGIHKDLVGLMKEHGERISGVEAVINNKLAQS